MPGSVNAIANNGYEVFKSCTFLGLHMCVHTYNSLLLESECDEKFGLSTISIKFRLNLQVLLFEQPGGKLKNQTEINACLLISVPSRDN